MKRSAAAAGAQASRAKQAQKVKLEEQKQAKKVKPEEQKAEATRDDEVVIMLRWTKIEDGDWETPVERALPVPVGTLLTLAESCVATEQPPGESGERKVEVALVKKSGDREEEDLAVVHIEWWTEREEASLMHFNMHRQELADVSRTLWVAAGRRHRANIVTWRSNSATPRTRA